MKSLFFKLFLLIAIVVANSAIAQQPKTKVTLGIKPGYFFSSKGKGVLVDGVIEGKSAAKAGIKEGDIIVAFDGKPITTIFEYKDALSLYRSNDKVKVTIIRGKDELVVDAVF
ncbi:MAG: PDZ domain-containing protein [Chitinophagales bacterium]|nr:PDZ domain-containing protein [Chitinophagales bacterium]